MVIRVGSSRETGEQESCNHNVTPLHSYWRATEPHLERYVAVIQSRFAVVPILSRANREGQDHVTMASLSRCREIRALSQIDSNRK